VVDSFSFCLTDIVMARLLRRYVYT
jgi:hypothetical protein